MAENDKDDIKLFLDLALWFSLYRKMTIADLLEWISSNLAVDAAFLENVLPFYTEEQEKAERVLCKLLNQSIKVKKFSRTSSSRVLRKTDWCRTYSKAISTSPTLFYGFEVDTPLDMHLLGSLNGIASKWAEFIKKIEMNIKDSKEGCKFSERASNLKKAIDSASLQGVKKLTPNLTNRQRYALRKYVSEDEMNILAKSLDRWSSYQVQAPELIKKELHSILGIINNMEEKDRKANLNTLFETTAHLSILKTAVEDFQGWYLKSIEYKLDQERRRTNTVYNLKKGPLNLRIGKGNPAKLFRDSNYSGCLESKTSENASKKLRKSERLLQIRQLAGQSGSGYQPDIVMGFYCDYGLHNEENPHVIFGDAKRYLNSKIDGAYKDTIASTMVAYGHWGKLSIKPEPEWDKAFDCPVKPFFTLFFTSNGNSDERIKKCKMLPHGMPVREFSIHDMQEVLDESLSGKPSSYETSIRYWFEDITKQVEELFSC